MVLSTFNIGRRIVEYILQETDLQPFLDANLDSEWLDTRNAYSFAAVFSNDEDVRAYEYILRYHREYGLVPLTETFSRNFPSYAPASSEYTATELVDQALNAITTAILQVQLASMVDLAQEGRTEKLIEDVQALAGSLDLSPARVEFNIGVEAELRKMRISAEARHRFNSEHAQRKELKFWTGEELAGCDVVREWRIEDLISSGSNVLINAAYKSGKTTLILNMVRSLARGGYFLGTKKVHRKAKMVRVIDMEMPLATAKEWIMQMGLHTQANVEYAFLAGRAGDLSLFDDRHLNELATKLEGTEVLIVDPVGPLMAALGLDENSNSDIRKMLYALTVLKTRCGASELVVVHHAGHADKGRARGASAFGDWPDTIIDLRNTQPDDIDGLRELRARGRDINYKCQLFYDTATRELSDVTTKHAPAEMSTESKILAALAAGQLSSKELRVKVGAREQELYRALAELKAQGRIRITKDPEDSRKSVWELDALPGSTSPVSHVSSGSAF